MNAENAKQGQAPWWPVYAFWFVTLVMPPAGLLWACLMPRSSASRKRRLILSGAWCALFIVAWLSEDGHDAPPTAPGQTAPVNVNEPAITEEAARLADPRRHDEPAPPPEKAIPYEVVDRTTYLDIKLSMDIRLLVGLDELPDEVELAALSQRLYDENDGAKYERTYIAYYLPGMVINDGAWATGHHNPELEVRILGISPDYARILAAARPEAAGNRGKVLGRWVEVGIAACSYMIYEEDGKTYLREGFGAGQSRMAELSPRVVNGETRYFEMDPDVNQYFVINAFGELCIYDDDGLYKCFPRL